MSRIPAMFVVLVLLLLLRPAVVQARTRTGAVTIRGIAVNVTSSGFSFQTHAHGTLKVEMRPQTQVTEKGQSGAVTLRNGDHVGVRGFLTGTTMVAMTVRIYPVKPKPFTIRGTVVSVSSSSFVVDTGYGVVTIKITPATTGNVANGVALVRSLSKGQRVEVRVVGTGVLTAVHLHIYVTRAATHHVTVIGTVSSVGRGTISIDTGGSHVQVAITSSTSLIMGTSHVSQSALHPGMYVTVHACCAGKPLSATSVRIRKPKPPHAVLVRGVVRSVGSGKLILSSGGKEIICTVSSSTRVTAGSATSSLSAVKAGEQVSVRGRPYGSTLAASSVHVYATSQHSKTVIGTVVSVKGGVLSVVTSTGERWSIQPARGAPVMRSGRASSVGAIHPGDRIHARGVQKGSTLLATSVAVTAAKVKVMTLHGVIARLAPGRLVVTTTVGGSVNVTVPRGVVPLLHGVAAPAAALFAGARVTIRGTRVGSSFTARSVSVEVTARQVTGQVLSEGTGWMRVGRGTAVSVLVDLWSGVRITDAGKKVGSVHRSAWVLVNGYDVAAGHVHPSSIAVQHPAVQLSATVVSTKGTLTVVTSSGTTYVVRVHAGVSVDVGRYGLSVGIADLPAATRLHISGVMQSDGSVLASSINALIRSSILRGNVNSTTPHLTVDVAGMALTMRLAAGVMVVQGSRASSIDDLVLGDDITLHGYLLAHNVVLVRSIDLHRRLAAFDGTAASLTPDGFILQAAGGTARVIVSASTLISGIAPSVTAGATVHVTGYVRGDGVIEATRIKIEKPKLLFRVA